MSRIIVKNIPKEITEAELKNHFNKLGEITDIKIMKNEKGESRKFAFIGYRLEEQGKKSQNYFNNTYLKTCKIQVEEAKIQGDPSLNKKSWSKVRKENLKGSEEDDSKDDKNKKINQLLELAKQMSNKSKFDAVEQKMKKETEETKETEVEKEKAEQQVIESDKINEENSSSKKINPKRLYLRNLTFEVTEEDVRSTFEKFGELTEVHIPVNHRTNQSFGYGYISYATVESAVMAISEMDKTYYQGRVLHITPAMEKEEKVPVAPQKETKSASSQSDFKKQKREKMKASFDNETNWNYLFMNQNAVIESVSQKLNIPKSELMSKDNPNLAVQVAAMETTVINETKEWLSSQGINLDVLRGKRQECSRSKNIILIKNVSVGVNKEKLEDYFSRYGMLVRFLLTPNNTIAIAEFVDKKHAENCMKKLAYFEVDGLPLYLEFAPEGFVKKNSKAGLNEKTNLETDNKSNEIDLKKGQGKIVFITNLNFSTKENRLKKFLEEKGYKPKNVKIVTHKKEDSDKILSKGFGFTEFEDEATALKAIKNLQGVLLDAHSLKLSLAKTSNKNEEKEREKLLNTKRKNETELNDYEYKGEEVTNNKLLVKNLAFEANKEELRKLFKTFGEVKSVRVPSKLDGTHRGFAFVDFVSHEEAKAAFKSLQNTHFYGRKLVLEWAQKEKTVDDLRQETERKVNAINIKTHRTQLKGEMDMKNFNKK